MPGPPLNLQGLAWNFAAPGGESQRQVEGRMLAYLAECVLPGLEPGDRAIVVSHGEAGRGLAPCLECGANWGPCRGRVRLMLAEPKLARPAVLIQC